MYSTKIRTMSKQLILIFLLLNFTTLFAQRAELIERRTLYSKTYRNSDNTLSTTISAGPVHFRDNSDKLEEIDRNIRPSDTEYDYEVTQGFYHAYFNSDLLSEFPVAFETKDGAALKTKLVAMAYLDANSKDYKIIQNVQPSEPIISRNEVYYPNVFDGVDLKYIYKDYRLKEEIFVTQTARDNLPDPKTLGMNKNNTSIVFITQLGLEGTPNIYAKNEKIKDKIFEGSEKINFRNLNGDVKFFLPVDWAFHEADRDSFDTGTILEIRKRLIHKPEGDFLLAGVKLKDLEKMRSGTIVFDPQVVLGDAAIESYDTSLNYKNGSSANATWNWGARDQSNVQRSHYGSYHIWRTLVHFDLTLLPPNATITQADFKMNYKAVWSLNIYDIYLDLHKMTAAWNEGSLIGAVGEASWNKCKPGTNWTVAGGDFEATATVTATVTSAPTLGTWETWDITTLATGWYADSNSNNGLVVKTRNDGVSQRTYFGFHSSESSTTSARPILEITYNEAAPLKTTYYVRDASGQVIATYDDE